jgi:opacity protein-like surface antigen
MKKIKVLLASLVLLFAVNGAYAIDSNLDFRVGAGYPYIVNMPALDFGLNFDLGLDKYFALSFETGFNWVNMKTYKGTGSFTNPTTVTFSDGYSLPLLVNAKVRFDMRESIGIMPYIMVGAGYGWTFHSTGATMATLKTDTYGGFTWQALAGIAIKLGSDSNINLIFDVGYRGSLVYLYTSAATNQFALDMSSIFAHIGVSFPLMSNN